MRCARPAAAAHYPLDEVRRGQQCVHSLIFKRSIVMMSDQPKDRAGFKILVVEDSLLDFELMQATLSDRFPCQITLAMTKGEFEKQLAQNQPDLIVSDS